MENTTIDNSVLSAVLPEVPRQTRDDSAEVGKTGPIVWMRRAADTTIIHAFDDDPCTGTPLCGARFRLPATFIEVSPSSAIAGPHRWCRTCLDLAGRRS